MQKYDHQNIMGFIVSTLYVVKNPNGILNATVVYTLKFAIN